jgi:hypothetical protein
MERDDEDPEVILKAMAGKLKAAEIIGVTQGLSPIFTKSCKQSTGSGRATHV